MADQKFNFAQTCNLLSQYLKEKRSCSGLQVQQPTTMNLLTNMEANPAADQTTTPSSSSSSKQPNIDLFPELVKNPEAVLPELQPGSAAPMTIFYGGQVLVLNDLQAEKAREIIGLAATIGSPSKNISAGFVCSGVEKLVSAEPNIVANSQEIPNAQPQAIGSDLPIARRASLHKFLAKRKERVAAIAPYQMNHLRASSPSKSDEQMSSRDIQAEGQCSKQLELRLF